MTSMKTILGTSLIAASLALSPVWAGNTMVERSQLERMAETARTPKDHLAVSKQFKLQAEHFEKKAESHEAEARRLENSVRNPTHLKWPGLSGQPWIKERQLAVEARRAANECLEAADRHSERGLELLAEASDNRTERARK